MTGLLHFEFHLLLHQVQVLLTLFKLEIVLLHFKLKFRDAGSARVIHALKRLVLVLKRVNLNL